MQISDNGLVLVTQSEGLRLEAYLDRGGVPTIGYGHTKGVKLGDKVTQYEALNLLREDTKDAVDAVNKLVRVTLTQNQFDAICDFVFNLGEGAFARSTMLNMLNSRNYEGASYEFQKWNHDNGKVVAGLTIRRKREADLFRT